MKKGIILILVLMLTVSWAFAQKGAPIQYDPSNHPAPIRQGGDTIADATVIGVLPYNDFGTTAGYVNDYDEVCPYTGSTSPDVVYSFTPAGDVTNGFVTLCGDTDYDSKLYIYENTVTPGTPFACNDDTCVSALGQSYVSELTGLTFAGGNTYYIVVDGYGGNSGNYEIDITGDGGGPVLDPPLDVTVDDVTGTVSWSAPAAGATSEWLIYDTDVVGFSGIGAEATDYSLIWASKWVPADLTAYDTGYVTKVAVNQYTDPTGVDYVTEVRVMSGDGMTVLYTQDVTGMLTIGWNEIVLDSAVPFDNTENLWIGMYVERPGGTANEPTGGSLTVMTERYDYFSYNGEPWTSIYLEYGFDAEAWMLRGFVSTSPAGRSVALGHVDLDLKLEKGYYTEYTGSTPTGNGMIAADPNHVYTPFDEISREFLGYNVYLDGTFVEFTTDLFYQYAGLVDGTTYLAGVTADYDEGESEIVEVDFVYDPVPVLDPPVNLAVVSNPADDFATFTWEAPGSGSGFNDGFETYDDFALEFAPWILVDGDGSTTYSITDITFPNQGYTGSYIIFNPYQTTPAMTDADPHSGDKMAACFAATSFLNDDWMIAPQATIANGDEVSFFARSYTDAYGLERFNVAVSTTGTAPADFTVISGTSYVEAPVDWTEYNYDLSAYAGQSIYVAIQCVTADAFIFFVDDFHIGAPADIAYASVPTMNGAAIKGTSTFIPAIIIATDNSRELLGYNVYLDGVQEGNTTDLFWEFAGLENGVEYIAGVEAVYDEGISDLVDITFLYEGTLVGDVISAATRLNGNYPNPFNPVTNIAYSIKETGNVTLEVYNLKGQLVKTLVNDVKETGDYTEIWNGTDNTGKSVSSGVYFYKMKASNYTATKKMILMK